MKNYVIRLTQNNFNRRGNILRSPVFDLYENSHYINYSSTKAPYGTNLLGDGTYTGLNRINSTNSEIGYVRDGRFVDTSGRIDITDWYIEPSSDFLDVNFTLAIFNAEQKDATPYYLHSTPNSVNDWAIKDNIIPGTPILMINAERYAFVELQLDADIPTTNIEFVFYLFIDIDSPVINGYFPATKRIQDKFPEWMDIREYNPSDPENATPATPSSIGGKLINALAGEWLTDLRSKIQYEQFQYFIDTADINQKDWIYVGIVNPPLTSTTKNFIYSAVGDGVQLTRVSGISEFHSSSMMDDVFFFNSLTNEIFTNKQYTSLVINGSIVNQTPYQIWNAFDDIGVGVDLFRFQLEGNDSFKKRILDVYKNRPGITIEAFKKTLRREFNLWKYYGATPDSNYYGATPEVLSMEQIEEDSLYFEKNGIPKQSFKLLINDLAIKYPMTWGNFKYDFGFWDPDGLERKGFGTLPRQLDATPVDELYRQSGVGDINDLFVFKPGINTGTETFDVSLSVRGKRKSSTVSEYLPIEFDVMVWGQATDDLWSNPTVTGKFTIELTVLDNSASPASPNQDIYYSQITLQAKNDVDYDTATPTDSSASYCEWYTADGRTDIAYRFYSRTTGEEAPGGYIDLADVTKIEVIPGHFNGDSSTPSYEDVPDSSSYNLSFVGFPAQKLGYGGTSSISINGFNYLSIDPEIKFTSLSVNHIGATPNGYISEAYTYRIKLNGELPNMTQKNFTLQMPSIQWPASTSNRLYHVQILTTNGSEYGAQASSNAATPIFINSSYIKANNDSTWTLGKKTFLSSVSSVIFSSGTGSAYPATVDVWIPFEMALTESISGIVDQNGPWRYGEPPGPDNHSYLLENLFLTRNDFGVPNNTSYIVTWLGISSISNPEVSCWLESNTIVPAVIDPTETNLNVSYNNNAIIETLDQSNIYEFSEVRVYAKLKPLSNAQWYPKVHSGWFHDDIEEYYLYADPVIENATANSKTLSGIPRQGAPVIVKAIKGSTPKFEMRQTALWQNDATPTLGSVNVEYLNGTDSADLYVAYKDIRNVSVVNTTTNTSVTVLSSTDNKVKVNQITNSDFVYKVTYTVNKSFYLDNHYSNSTSSKIFFDATPGYYNADYYQISYESSIYDPATPVDIPLNPLYTSMEEGFIYIDHDVHKLSLVEMKVTPSKILADGKDYGLVTLRAYDVNGNPKPNEKFLMFTNFGTLDHATISTDRDGYGYTYITSELWDGSINPWPATPSLPSPNITSDTQGLIVARGSVEVKTGFNIQLKKQDLNTIVANPIAQNIMADGDNNFIVGHIEDKDHNPVPYAAIKWRKGRTLYELFNSRSYSTNQATPGSSSLSGMTFADSVGKFTIGPFSSDGEHGYWFVSVESNSASPSFNTKAFELVGDVVYWYEHPEITSIVDDYTHGVSPTVQDATPISDILPMTSGPAFPSSYEEGFTTSGYVANVINWRPPSWFPISQFDQYQMGLYGNSYEVTGATPRYPDYKEI